MENQMEMVSIHIDFLKSLDTEEFYHKDEDEVQRYAHETIKELIQLGHHATSELIELLHTEFTWSCYFALTIFRQTKDPLVVPSLISFLNKESDDSMANEEAMLALQDIGDPSVIPLIEDIEDAFVKHKYNSYLIGALTGIIGPTPYDFMVKITKDFIGKPWRYKGWFQIEDFTYNFVKQNRPEVISLLKQILDMKIISGLEKQELENTIRALEDPTTYEKEIQEITNELSETTQ